MRIFAIFSTLLLATGGAAESGTNELPFGTLNLQIRSRSNSEAREFLTDLLKRTSEFLDEHFSDYFANTVASDYFSNVGLRVINFNVETTVNAQVLASVDFDGSTFYSTRPVPNADFIRNLLKEAFQGDSRLEFVGELQLSNVALLSDLTYLVVGVNGKIVANEDLTLYTPEASDAAPAGSNSAKIAIVAGIGAGSACLFLVAVFILISIRRRKDTTTQRGHVSRKRSPVIEESSTRSPSPIRSICSQESSKFTYNPKSVNASTIDGSSTIDSKTLPSAFSSLQVDVGQNIDIEAWQNNMISPITPAPFGHDISAIDKKDLSLIEEGTDEDDTPASRQTASYLNRKALTRLDYSELSPQKLTSKPKPKFVNDSWYSEEESSHYSDGSDVINDLKNLSRQIHRKRGVF